MEIPKHSLIIECRVCGDFGFYEDIRDDREDIKPDYEFGECGGCEEEENDEEENDEEENDEKVVILKNDEEERIVSYMGCTITIQKSK